MGERKPSERWIDERYGRYALHFGEYSYAAVSRHAVDFRWIIVIGDSRVRQDAEGGLEAAQLAAEDALLEIAREIREAVGRD